MLILTKTGQIIPATKMDECLTWEEGKNSSLRFELCDNDSKYQTWHLSEGKITIIADNFTIYKCLSVVDDKVTLYRCLEKERLINDIQLSS